MGFNSVFKGLKRLLYRVTSIPSQRPEYLTSKIAEVQIWPLRNKPGGTFGLVEREEIVRNLEDDHEPKIYLLCVDNTHNYCGESVLPVEWLDDLAARVKLLHIPLHMDGFRLFNAAVNLKVPASRIVRDFTSATFCICISCGCQFGCGQGVHTQESVIVSYRSRRLRKVLGGEMRQASIIGVAGIVALNSMFDRLQEDEKRANAIWKGYRKGICHAWKKHSSYQDLSCDKYAVRLLTYFEVTDADVEARIDILKCVMQGYE